MKTQDREQTHKHIDAYYNDPEERYEAKWVFDQTLSKIRTETSMKKHVVENVTIAYSLANHALGQLQHFKHSVPTEVFNDATVTFSTIEENGDTVTNMRLSYFTTLTPEEEQAAVAEKKEAEKRARAFDLQQLKEIKKRLGIKD